VTGIALVASLNGVCYRGGPARNGLVAPLTGLIGASLMGSWDWPHHEDAVTGQTVISTFGGVSDVRPN